MVDKDKLITAMHHHLSIDKDYSDDECRNCPYNDICDERGFESLSKDLLLLLGQQEAPQPVRESTSDFVRFNQGEIVVIINRHYVVDAAYKPSTDETYVCMRDGKPPAKYDGNIIDKITGGE